jgi:hypothetical protein
MRIKITLLSLLFAGVFTMSNAQNRPLKRCGTLENQDFLRQSNPLLDKQLQEGEQKMQDYINKQIQAQTAGATQRTSVVVTIPCVVHVVYKLPAQNITNAQIMSQMEVLNEDFRRLNADTVNTPIYFQGIAADVEFEFCLAQTDPNGNATDGITRTLTADNSFSQDNQVKFTSQGGHDAWDVTEYFNIWVCNLGGGLLGYAEFPTGSPSNTYGVVIGYNYFGRGVGPLSPPYNLGRTATHEVGHCFNLKHIWGDDGNACSGSDLVADTPNQADENYSCGGITISCTNGPNGDNWQNYMDYTDDDCMNMFTEGQKTRMTAALNGLYPTLITSTVCNAVSAVNENTHLALFEVFPNPAKDEVKINYNLVSEGTLKVFNVLGEKVYEQTVAANDNQMHISLKNFADGTYTMMLISPEINKTQKLVVKK